MSSMESVILTQVCWIHIVRERECIRVKLHLSRAARTRRLTPPQTHTQVSELYHPNPADHSNSLYPPIGPHVTRPTGKHTPSTSRGEPWDADL